MKLLHCYLDKELENGYVLIFFFGLGDNLHHIFLCIRVDNSIENSLIFVLTYMKFSLNCQVQDQNRVNARLANPGLFASIFALGADMIFVGLL